MRFSKPALTIDQQVNRLVERGMIVADRELAAHYLGHLNYYHLRGYWLPFEDRSAKPGEHRFRAGTTFEEVLNRYVFDRELRLLVMDAMERVEVSVRTQWAYHFSHAEGPHGHLRRSAFTQQRDYTSSLGKVTDEVGRSREDFITHFVETYDESLPPIWAVVEVLSLGQLSRWYKNLADPSLRQRVADSYGMDEKILSSLLHHLSVVRNVCAHHGRLWNRKFSIKPKLPSKKPGGLSRAFHPQESRRLYNTLVLIAYLMNVVSPGNRWRDRLVALLAKHDQIPVGSMGFPAGWQELPYWKDD